MFSDRAREDSTTAFSLHTITNPAGLARQIELFLFLNDDAAA